MAKKKRLKQKAVATPVVNDSRTAADFEVKEYDYDLIQMSQQEQFESDLDYLLNSNGGPEQLIISTGPVDIDVVEAKVEPKKSPKPKRISVKDVTKDLDDITFSDSDDDEEDIGSTKKTSHKNSTRQSRHHPEKHVETDANDVAVTDDHAENGTNKNLKKKHSKKTGETKEKLDQEQNSSSSKELKRRKNPKSSSTVESKEVSTEPEVNVVTSSPEEFDDLFESKPTEVEVTDKKKKKKKSKKSKSKAKNDNVEQPSSSVVEGEQSKLSDEKEKVVEKLVEAPSEHLNVKESIPIEEPVRKESAEEIEELVNDVKEEVIPEDGISKVVKPEDVVKEDVIPENVISEDVTPVDVVPEIVTPVDVAPEDVTAKEETVEDAPENVIPEDATPKDDIPAAPTTSGTSFTAKHGTGAKSSVAKLRSLFENGDSAPDFKFQLHKPASNIERLSKVSPVRTIIGLDNLQILKLDLKDVKIKTIVGSSSISKYGTSMLTFTLKQTDKLFEDKDKKRLFLLLCIYVALYEAIGFKRIRNSYPDVVEILGEYGEITLEQSRTTITPSNKEVHKNEFDYSVLSYLGHILIWASNLQQLAGKESFFQKYDIDITPQMIQQNLGGSHLWNNLVRDTDHMSSKRWKHVIKFRSSFPFEIDQFVLILRFMKIDLQNLIE